MKKSDISSASSARTAGAPISKATLERAIAQWDRRQRNPHAGAIALQRLDEAWAEYEGGKPLARALYDNFNDRLLTALETAADLPVTYGGGGADRGRP